MAKESRNNFIESEGVRILAGFLESNFRIKAHFESCDKTPIFDGYFNLLDSDDHIIKEFEVQIKSTKNLHCITKGKNKGTFAYKMDVNVLNAARFKVSDNPIFYFVIDTINKIIFYKLLTKEFLISLNVSIKRDF